ncbi:sulfurtransferase TusA family protein [Methylophilus sp. VKM B-3414]|uniref:sulfurtransferase TusA family protein n=1 Tax=Methylophilus sp. VKM B-3414 TaxID=3076121 RepID=UPI0028C710E2|nr:sulfurtransferase TusA family protein [Methylophilus sp. VKM B-3414]MDT7849458.1 sulfurtransferase TusA family protein [Methylophilus sp. VKM B-3414]
MHTTPIDIELDLMGLDSPLPMLKTIEKLEQLLPGQVLSVKTTSAGSEQNIRNVINHHPVKLLSVHKEGGVFHFLIQKETTLAAD